MSYGEVFKAIRKKLKNEWNDVTHPYRQGDYTKVCIKSSFANSIGISAVCVKISNNPDETRRKLEGAVLSAVSETIARDDSALGKIEENLGLITA